MVNKDTIDQFYADVDSLGLKFPVAAITKATGFNKGTVSEYLSRKKEPSKRFLDAFYERFAESLKKRLNGHADTTGIEDKFKIPGIGALLSVLVREVADLKSEITGEHSEVIVRKIYRAAEDIEQLGKF